MNTAVLREAARIMLPIFLICAAFLFLRGHHEPGGGFIGGLVAAAGIGFVAVSRGATAARRIIGVHPLALVGVGLLSAIAAAFIAVAAGKPFFTGIWVKVTLIPGEPTKLGTPLLFDLGVFLLVVGIAVGFIEGLLRSGHDDDEQEAEEANA